MLNRAVRFARQFMVRYKRYIYGAGFLIFFAVGTFVRSNYLHFGEVSTLVSQLFPSSSTQSTVQGSLPAWRCAAGEARKDLQFASLPELRALWKLDKTCRSISASRTLHFVSLPADTASAEQSASSVAEILRAYQNSGIEPIIVAEPARINGDMLAGYANGSYEPYIKRFYQALRSQGVNDKMMGLWVLLPESNTPAWGNTDARHFAAAYSSVAKAQKGVFPQSGTAVLLDAKSYAVGDSTWSTGAYLPLTPYIQSIETQYIDTLGMQGFPWVPKRQTEGASLVDPDQFLPADQLIAAAKVKGIKRVWLNSGTPRAYYPSIPHETVVFSSEQRTTMSKGIVEQAAKLEAAGLDTSLNLFAQDKSATSENVDWSYWPIASDTRDDAQVLGDTVKAATDKNIDVWLFDTVQ